MFISGLICFKEAPNIKPQRRIFRLSSAWIENGVLYMTDQGDAWFFHECSRPDEVLSRIETALAEGQPLCRL